MKDRQQVLWVWIAALLTAGIFTADMLTPLGIAWGFLYIIVTLITLWVPGNRITRLFAAAGIILTTMGFLKPPPGIPMEIVITNRLLAVGGILAAARGIILHKEKEGLIREQKNELEKLALDLRNSNSDLEQFAYVASHDLQEPLRKIQWFGERLLLTEKPRLSEQGKDYLARMKNAAERMQRLINDLLSFSRLTTRTGEFTVVDLNQLLKEVLSDLEIAIERNGVTIQAGDLPVVVADPTQMRQLFQNLLSNSIKFRKQDISPVIRIYVKSPQTASVPAGEYYEICFSDNGIGFDKQYSDKVFSIFQQLNGRKYEGSGIGLAVCKKIVQRHMGSISVESSPDNGCTFTVTLPAMLPAAAGA
ncbi:MAG: ATP-binding protein [Bacteroidota bacterium]